MHYSSDGSGGYTCLDLVTGTNFIRDAVVIAFNANETISIVENVGLMGINIPGNYICD